MGISLLLNSIDLYKKSNKVGFTVSTGEDYIYKIVILVGVLVSVLCLSNVLPGDQMFIMLDHD